MDLKQIVDRIEVLKELIAERGLSEEARLEFNQKIRLEWNYHSVHMEGNKLTKGETEVLMLEGVATGSKHMDQYKEMQNHMAAVKYVEQIAPEGRPLTKPFIGELHTVLLKEPFRVKAYTADGKPTTKLIKVGEYKEQPNYAKTDTGEHHFFASPAETPAMMTELIDWCKGAEQTYGRAAAFARAAVFHYRFVSIHPFDDGNGRMARLLMNYLLLQADLPPVFIDSDKKDEYLAVLRQTSIDDPDPFIIYIGQQLIHSLELQFKAAKGESLEEPSDLDKRLVLIEQQVNNLNQEKIKQEKSEVKVHEIISDILLPIVKITDIRMAPLKNYFREFSLHWSHNGSGVSYPNVGVLHEYGIIADMETKFPDEVNITFQLKTFVKGGSAPFGVSGGLACRFSQFAYQIYHLNRGEEYWDSHYHHLPDKDEQKNIAEKMVQYLIDEMEGKIDKLSKQ